MSSNSSVRLEWVTEHLPTWLLDKNIYSLSNNYSPGCLREQSYHPFTEFSSSKFCTFIFVPLWAYFRCSNFPVCSKFKFWSCACPTFGFGRCKEWLMMVTSVRSVPLGSGQLPCLFHLEKASSCCQVQPCWTPLFLFGFVSA